MAKLDRDLALFIADYEKKQWDWEKVNCILFISDWTFWKTGIDLSERFRKEHKNKSQWLSLLKTSGGIVEFCKSQMNRVNINLTEAPTFGDVGLISSSKKKIVIGAIALGNGLWVVKRMRDNSIICVAEPLVTCVAAWGLS